MYSGRIILIVLFLVSLHLTAAAQEPQPMTNAEVRQMVKTGFSAELIITKIKASKTAFDTSAASLGEMKEAGVSEQILMAMIEAGAVKPTPVPADAKNEEMESAKAAIKSLRRMATAVEVGISYTNYSPLLADVKTEVDDTLAKIGPGNLKTEIESALSEYAYAGSVWQATWNRDLLPQSLEEVAVSKYGLKRGGLLKVIWRDTMLQEIWRVARNHFEIANSIVNVASPARAVASEAGDDLVGAWIITLINPADTTKTFVINATITLSGGVYKGTFRSPFGNATMTEASKTGNAFVLKASEKTKKQYMELGLDGTVDANQMKGTATLILNKDSASVSFTGKKLVN